MDNLSNFEPTIIKLAKAYSIPPLEWEDIAQELRLHLWLNRAEYDPKRPYNDWAYITCRNKIRNLAKYYHRQKRDVRKEVSLDELMEKGFEKEG